MYIYKMYEIRVEMQSNQIWCTIASKIVMIVVYCSDLGRDVIVEIVFLKLIFTDQ